MSETHTAPLVDQTADLGYEGLGCFYLGRTMTEPGDQAPRLLDPGEAASQSSKPGGPAPTSSDPLSYYLYKSDDLLTHALCVGMTGSGKTGLGISLLEEAAIDGIPALVIDPKGDLPNLALSFANPSPEDYRPWVEGPGLGGQGGKGDPAQAAYDRHVAGMQASRQGLGRAQKIWDQADIRVYAPGSRTGQALSLAPFFVPQNRQLGGGPVESNQDLLAGNTRAFLSLLNYRDELASPAQVFLTQLFQYYADGHEPFSWESFLQRLLQPPFDKVGFLPVETYFPAEERRALSFQINSLLASPDFGRFFEGQTLTIQDLFYSPTGKAQISILYLAHLEPKWQQFVITTFLNQVLAWLRTQAGSSHLRYLLYMDEIVNLAPPVANPPAKATLLTLLKQSRAYGLGLILATQNPGDIDYKGLSNIGTYFIGRLNTDRDRQKLLEGLEEEELTGAIQGLKPREFIARNVHEQGLTLFSTRECLSFLRGPMLLTDLARLPGQGPHYQEGQSQAHPGPMEAQPAQMQTQSNPMQVQPGSMQAQPSLMQDQLVPMQAQHTPMQAQPDPVLQDQKLDDVVGGGLISTGSSPRQLYALVDVFFEDKRRDFRESDLLVYRADPQPGLRGFAWEKLSGPELLGGTDQGEGSAWDAWSAEEKARRVEEYFQQMVDRHETLDLESYYQADQRKGMVKAVEEKIYQEEVLALPYHPTLKLYQEAGESLRSFRIRVQAAAKDETANAVDALTEKYQKKMETAQNALTRAEQRMGKEEDRRSDLQRQELFGIGNAIFSTLLGKRKISSGNLGKMTTAGRAMSRTSKQKGDLARAEENLSAAQDKLAALQKSFEEEMAALQEGQADALDQVKDLHIRPLKSNIHVKRIFLQK